MITIDALRMPSVSRECMRVLQMLDDEHCPAQSVIDTIALDPILTSTLIKYANSPAHNRGRVVSSLRSAITLLGFRQVRAAAVVASMRGFRSVPGELDSQLWEQGVAISTVARRVADRCFRSIADEAELVGLLHNLGAIVLLGNFPEAYTQLADGVRQDGTPIQQAERELFGLHRGDLIPALGERFRLPPRLAQVLEAYHQGRCPTELNSVFDRLLAALWIAHTATRRSPAAAHWLPECEADELPALLQSLDLGEEDLLDLADDGEDDLQQRLCPVDAQGHASFHFAPA